MVCFSINIDLITYLNWYKYNYNNSLNLDLDYVYVKEDC